MASVSTMTLAVNVERKRITSKRGIEDLPPELLEEIFLRIPVHYLTQTKYVCQPWRNLISNPLFPIMHHARNPNPTTLIFVIGSSYDWFIPDLDTCEKAITFTKLRLLRTEETEHCEIVGSLNGFVCFEMGGCCQPLLFKILNPFIIGDPITLPPCIDQFHPNTIDFTYFNGFGYSPNTKEYKVIRMIEQRDGHILVRICTVGSNSWRDIGPLPDERDWKYSYAWGNYSGVFLNGYLHWLVPHRNRPNADIKAFNVEDETFGLVPIPPPLFGNMHTHTSLYLGVLSNCLIMVDSSFKDIQIWMMEEYGVENSWVCQFIIHEMPCAVQPLAFQKNGNILCNKYGRHIGNFLCDKYGSHINYPKLFSYEPQTEITNKIRVTGLPKRCGRDTPGGVISHVGTLFTVENVVHKERM